MIEINGRTAFLRLLATEGVEYLFGNPGTTELAIMEALGRQNEINYVLGLQESVVVAMADGYARAEVNSQWRRPKIPRRSYPCNLPAKPAVRPPARARNGGRA